MPLNTPLRSSRHEPTLLDFFTKDGKKTDINVITHDSYVVPEKRLKVVIISG